MVGITYGALVLSLLMAFAPSITGDVPNIVHMVFTDNRPMASYTFLSILTVMTKIKPQKLYIHSVHKPHGPFWTMAEKEFSKSIEVKEILEPISIFGHSPGPRAFAHKSDIARMNILTAQGGIYIDSDIIVLRSFEDLMKHPLTLGLQTDKNLCNAVILTQSNSVFLREWYEGYRHANFEKCWDCTSVQFPSKLWANATMKNLVNALPVEAFYDPSFGRHDVRELYQENKEKPARVRPPYDGKYGQHLWHALPLADKFLRAHQFSQICDSTSIYNEMLRFALNGTAWLRATCPGGIAKAP
jgi:Glycosyltransferase sugar-binding region containing DXD motif